jgi:tRNA-Thr(GGU) m(6)t(6)A37 methyltransferase TsaA
MADDRLVPPRVPHPIPRYAFEPIGFVSSPFVERVEAPRQATAAAEVSGVINLLPGKGYDHALDGLSDWDRMWVIFVFHKNVEQARGWKPKVLPPRSERKRGLFATRSPHRPNPIGMSAVMIDRVEGLSIHVRGLDLLDGTPVLDLKPYVAYADAFPEARAGWLAAPDPIAPFVIAYDESARAQLDWLRAHGVDLQPAVDAALALGPEPHPYRRIRRHGDGMRLALKDWRVDFFATGRTIEVRGVTTGYRPKELAGDASLSLHRDFIARWAARTGQ